MATEAREFKSINPATEELLAAYSETPAGELNQALDAARSEFRQWRKVPFPDRARQMKRLAAYLREQKSKLAGLIVAEMGKPITQAEAEIEKSARNCDYYAEHAESFLSRQHREALGRESYVQFVPLGVIFAIMPWNFPVWQVFRFAVPALMAGNAAILKHASNVPQCALAIEEALREVGFPRHLFRSLLLSSAVAEKVVEDSRIAAVTLTGSDRAGSHVGAAAGRSVKKCVLELGGSDPFIVLEDADVEAAAEAAVRARFQNTGQSCIAAKRFIVVQPVFQAFREAFLEHTQALRVGDPTDRDTEVGPLARDDLRAVLEDQVARSVDSGAQVLCGGRRIPGPGYFFQPTLLTEVHPEMAVFREEIFGPVAALVRARDASHAIELANDSPYGLGSNLWTADLERARRLAGEIEAGQVFVNGMVASDPRLPFGGVKNSGYGRELGDYGIREFVNIQTVVIG